MKIPPLPAGEDERQAALEAYRILDTDPEQAFEDLVRTASYICGTPTALISLIDRDRQWFKAKLGMDATETPREISFCGHAILEDQVMVVPDSMKDARFATNPLVSGEPKIRFYAGAPLITPSGHRVGTLCVIDYVARGLKPDQVRVLEGLARQAIGQMELRIQLWKLLTAEREAIRLKEEATAASVAKADYLSRLSHEIRTPMNGIVGIVELLQSSSLTPEQRDHLTTVQSCAKALVELTSDILDMAKIDAGKQELEQAPMNLATVVNEVVALFRPLAQKKGLQLSHNLPPIKEYWVVGDTTRLKQVLGNLVSNALKFTSHGFVWIEVDSPGNGQVNFAVHDSGPGISAEALPKLFKPFAQADASTSRFYGGSGLGLSICQSICEKMGGRIWVEENAPGGTVIRFNFLAPNLAPETDVPVIAAVTPIKSDPVAARKVLVAEDNSTNRLVILGYLAKLGYTADVALDGLEAVKMAHQTSYDLILMDYQMPNLGGVEATRQIRASEKIGTQPTIIALTASADQDAVNKFYEAGCDQFLAKPLGIASLRSALEKIEAARRTAPVIDFAEFANNFGDIPEHVPILLGKFLQSRANLVERIRGALGRKDTEDLRSAAHSLKGMLAQFYAAAASRAAAELERVAGKGDLPKATELATALFEELRLLDIELEDPRIKKAA